MNRIWALVLIFSYAVTVKGYPHTGLRNKRQDDIWLYQYPPFGNAPPVVGDSSSSSTSLNAIRESGRQNQPPAAAPTFNAPLQEEFQGFKFSDSFAPNPLTPLSRPDFLQHMEIVLQNSPDQSAILSAFSQTLFPEDLPNFVKGTLTLEDFGRQGKSAGTNANANKDKDATSKNLAVQIGEKWIWKG